MPFVIAIIFFAVIWLGYRYWTKNKLRKQLLRSSLSREDWDIVLEQVPLIHQLPEHLKMKLQGKINLFLHQVKFHGCNGLEMNRKMELSIAVQACLLIVNRNLWYKNLFTILVYPSAFKSRQANYDGDVIVEEDQARLGESWSHGPVVLSWEHTEIGAANEKDGNNLVFHEFAHQLDDLSGHTNAIPILAKGQSYAEWEKAFLDAYERHVQAIENGNRTFIDEYGAENHVEFLAVTMEVFFEKPKKLHEEESEVYEQLSKLLRLDPKSW